jgi:hypothetical protein
MERKQASRDVRPTWPAHTIWPERKAPKLANVVSRKSGEIRKRASLCGDGDIGELAQSISS